MILSLAFARAAAAQPRPLPTESVEGPGAGNIALQTSVDYAPGVVLAQVAAIVNDGGWLQGGSDGRSAAGKAAGY